jgi:putative flavoprotein involved in K+ transport
VPREDIASPVDSRSLFHFIVYLLVQSFGPNIRQFARDGVVNLGRLTGVDGNHRWFGSDAEDILAASDKAYLDFKRIADDYASTNKLVSEEPAAVVHTPIEDIPSLDLTAANITSVVWGTGYDFDFRLAKDPVFDDRGGPVQGKGVTHWAWLFCRAQ